MEGGREKGEREALLLRVREDEHVGEEKEGVCAMCQKKG